MEVQERRVLREMGKHGTKSLQYGAPIESSNADRELRANKEVPTGKGTLWQSCNNKKQERKGRGERRPTALKIKSNSF